MNERFLEAAEEAMRDVVERRINAIRNTPSLKPIGLCYNCQEKIGSSKLFCDLDCRSDYEYRKKYGKA
jgi:hypothetical protein